jgi:hypothetical protein
MPCTLRVEYPGAMYHVMSRGNRRQDIYLNDVDRHDFLKTLAEAWDMHITSQCYGLTLLLRGLSSDKTLTWPAIAGRRIALTLSQGAGMHTR